MDSDISSPPPWRVPQWRQEAEAWIHAELARLGHAVAGPIEEVKIWSISCVLRARSATTDEAFYFKAALNLPLFVNEPVVTQGLAALYPAHIPTPLSIEPMRRWMLLADFGSPVPGGKERPPLETRKSVLQIYGQMQFDSARHIDHLLAIGCLDRRLPRLGAQAAMLSEAADEPVFGLNDDEAQRFRSRVPRFVALCEELGSFAVPPALVHGDLHFGNIAIFPDGKPIFFDWTDACVAHPFLDMIEIRGEEDAPIRDAYLSLWEEYEKPERLRAAWSLAEPLTALHQAVSYYHIAANLAPTGTNEMASALPHFLRRAMEMTE